jgi:hypothetical protein
MPQVQSQGSAMEFVGDNVTLEVFLLLAFPANCQSTSVSSVASTNGPSATSSALELP